MSAYYFIEPTDSLFVRGNLAFGDSGEHGAAVMPPPPSLFAGALRAAILGRDAGRLARFQRDGKTGDPLLDGCLGVLDPVRGEVREEGAFRLSWLSLGGVPAAGEVVESIHTLPADLVSLSSEDTPAGRQQLPRDGDRDPALAVLDPQQKSSFAPAGGPLPMQAVLRCATQRKPQRGRYLRAAGWQRHLEGTLPLDGDAREAAQWCASAEAVHRADSRLGVGLDSATRTASQGLLYTTDGHAFSPPAPGDGARDYVATGFVVGVEGTGDLLPDEGMLRLGGDGRSARYRRVSFAPPGLSPERASGGGRFRLVLLTPGLFANGWIPDGVEPEGATLMLRNAEFSARLVCAAVPRHEVVSGWNLLRWAPKPALRAVPAGSVYWFDDFQGDPGKLAAWAERGLAGHALDAARRAEGFNLAQLGCWQARPGRLT